MTPSILIVGFGNPLMGDDGFGHSVVTELQKNPGAMRSVACFGDVFRLMGVYNGEDHLWAVDICARGAVPGTIRVFEHDDVTQLDQQHGAAHQLSLPEGLRTLRRVWPAMQKVRIRLFSVEPQDLAAGRPLSPPVETAVTEVAALIRAEFQRKSALPR